MWCGVVCGGGSLLYFIYSARSHGEINLYATMCSMTKGKIFHQRNVMKRVTGKHDKGSSHSVQGDSSGRMQQRLLCTSRYFTPMQSHKMLPVLRTINYLKCRLSKTRLHTVHDGLDTI